MLYKLFKNQPSQESLLNNVGYYFRINYLDLNQRKYNYCVV